MPKYGIIIYSLYMIEKSFLKAGIILNTNKIEDDLIIANNSNEEVEEMFAEVNNEVKVNIEFVN